MLGIKMAAPSSDAKQRWNILGEALRTKKLSATSAPISLRRFASFGLFHSERLDGDWCSYTLVDEQLKSKTRLDIRNVDDSLVISDLVGFNNTGNICVWPSEEVLSYYSVKNAHIFAGKNVCELGGGMTCLAGLTVAVSSAANRVLLTDGNAVSIKNVQEIVKRNSPLFGHTNVEARILRWGDVEDASLHTFAADFDFILCADCFFFEDTVGFLLEIIEFLLKDTGTAICLAPSRGNTFDDAVHLAKARFQVNRIDFYDAKIQKLHAENMTHNCFYNPDLHLPLMLEIRKLKPGDGHFSLGRSHVN